jgi:hypothetical protein
MITRDSMTLWLGLLIAVFGYLGAAKPPTEWSYAEWIQAAAFILAWVSGKLATSPLKGDKDAMTVNVNRPGGVQ